MSKSLFVAVLLCAFVAATVAYAPVAPSRGSYNWELVTEDEKAGDYTGGRWVYDWIAGFVRLESYNNRYPSPGINGVSIWNLRDEVIYVIDELVDCYVIPLTDENGPHREDWGGYKYSKDVYYNRHLTEEWTDGYGGVVYVDAFDRDIVGFGNQSTVPGEEVYQWIVSDFSSTIPEAEDFIVPRNLDCKPLNGTEVFEHFQYQPRGFLKKVGKGIKKAVSGTKCPVCKTVVTVIQKTYGGKVGAVANLIAKACNTIPVAAKLCKSFLGPKAAQIGKLLTSGDTVTQVCKAIKAC